jgi:hypothetical protein
MVEADVVVFRKWKDNGDVIALFPDLPSDLSGKCCSSYEHIGQHSGADFHAVIRQTRPCPVEDSADLVTELERIGYRLRPIKRASRVHHDARRQLAADLRNTM